MGILNEQERERVNNCLYDINDKLKAIDLEMKRDKQYKSYLTEKIESALWDMQVIKHICQEEK